MDVFLKNSGYSEITGSLVISGSLTVNGIPFSGATSGTSGTSGVDGSSGTSGTSGIGVSGSSGTSGTSGVDGSSGTSGTSGVSGSSGTSGTSGTSPTSSLFACGSFYNNADQTINGPATATVSCNSTFFSSGVTLNGTTGFTVSNTGVYSVTLSAFFDANTGTSLLCWLRKNGSNILINNRQGYSTGDNILLTANWLVELAANDVLDIQIYIDGGTTILQYTASPPGGGPSLATTVNINQER